MAYPSLETYPSLTTYPGAFPVTDRRIRVAGKEPPTAVAGRRPS